MTPDEAIRRAKSGDLSPVYVLFGEERLLVEQVIAAVREAALAGAPAAFNEDKFTAGETDVDKVIAAARMVPMLAQRRVVLVRAVERWDPRAAAADGEEADSGSKPAGALDRLAEYAASPVPTTSLLLVAAKLDTRRKLVTLAKKQDFAVPCEPVARAALPGWITRAAKARGHVIAGPVADLLAEVAGPELANVADALERTALYVGQGQPITEDAIDACVVRMRQSTVWELVAAIGRRDAGKALAALADVYDPRDRGLRLVGLIAWSTRQLLKFESAQRQGASPEEAAKRAGAPPFKARELAAQVRAIPRAELERWLGVLAATDLALKGSKRPPLATVETMLLELCGG